MKLQYGWNDGEVEEQKGREERLPHLHQGNLAVSRVTADHTSHDLPDCNLIIHSIQTPSTQTHTYRSNLDQHTPSPKSTNMPAHTHTNTWLNLTSEIFKMSSSSVFSFVHRSLSLLNMD